MLFNKKLVYIFLYRTAALIIYFLSPDKIKRNILFISVSNTLLQDLKMKIMFHGLYACKNQKNPLLA